MKKGFVLFPVFQIDEHFTFYYFSFVCPFLTVFIHFFFLFLFHLYFFLLLLFNSFFLTSPTFPFAFSFVFPFPIDFSLSLSLSLSLSFLFCFFSCSSFYLLYSHYICPGHRGQMVTKAFHVNEKISYWLDPQMGKRGEGARGFVSLIFYCFLITGIV